MGKDKLKVLTVNVSDSSGGAARAAYRIHHAVKAAGVMGQFLVKNKNLTDASVIAVDGFDTFKSLKVPFRWVQHKLKNKLQQVRWRPYPHREDVFLSDLRSSSIHGAFQKIDFDVLHLHWINLRFLDLKELSNVRKPIIWTLHDCWPFCGICHYFDDCTLYQQSCGNCPALKSEKSQDLSREVWRIKEQLYASLNLHIVCPSNWLADAARNSSLFSRFPVSVIPNPIDTEFFKPGDKRKAREVLNLDDEKKYILYGAMNAVKDRRKGYRELIEALSIFESQNKDVPIELIVFGAKDTDYDLKLSFPVRYLGYIHDDCKMVSVYQSVDVMVVPSLSENLSNAIMESMSCGTPVVAFNIGGNGDMIEHKVNGYLAKEKDAKDLAAGIHWLLGSDNLASIGKNARKKVNDNFSMNQVANQYVTLYKSFFL